MHLNIAHYVKDWYKQEQYQGHAMDLSYHFNESKEIIVEDSDLICAAKLNYFAGLEARTSFANASAKNQFALGMEFLKRCKIETLEDLEFNAFRIKLFRALINSKNTNEESEETEQLCCELISYCHTREERLSAVQTFVGFYFYRHRFVESFSLASVELKDILQIPADPVEIEDLKSSQFDEFKRLVSSQSAIEKMFSSNLDETHQLQQSVLMYALMSCEWLGKNKEHNLLVIMVCPTDHLTIGM
jgi:hypothetical protein